MSRRQNPDRQETYRAVVTHPRMTIYYGPYATRGAAKAALTRENRKWSDYDTPIHPERIEYSELNWKVDE